MGEIFDRIKIQLLTEMTDIESLFNGDSTYTNHNSKVNTDELVIHYTVKGEDKFMILHYTDIINMMRERAKSIRQELITDKKMG